MFSAFDLNNDFFPGATKYIILPVQVKTISQRWPSSLPSMIFITRFVLKSEKEYSFII